MNDHTTPSERKATKAPAIVAFLVYLVLGAIVVALLVLSITGTRIHPAVTGLFFALALSVTIITVAWATRKKGK